MPRKAFLLAAGEGTRLKPLTDTTPKCLLPLGGRPLLDWWLRVLEHLGVEEVLVNTHHLSDQVESFLGARRGGVLARAVHEPRLLGSAGTVAANRRFVQGEAAFWIFYADTVIAADLAPLARLHRESGACLTIGLFKSPDPRAGGVVETGQHNEVISFEEKPAAPRSEFAAAGAYVAGQDIFKALLPSRISGPAVLDLGRDVLPKLVSCARALLLDGSVIDIGTPRNYALARKEWNRIGLEKRLGGAA